MDVTAECHTRLETFYGTPNNKEKHILNVENSTFGMPRFHFWFAEIGGEYLSYLHLFVLGVIGWPSNLPDKAQLELTLTSLSTALSLAWPRAFLGIKTKVPMVLMQSSYKVRRNC